MSEPTRITGDLLTLYDQLIAAQRSSEKAREEINEVRVELLALVRALQMSEEAKP